MSKRLAAAEQFVGRAGELRQLDAALTTSANGRGVLVVVSGEPGIGKTRFCDEVASMAQRRGFTVVNGRCWVDGGAPAFWPWQPVLRELCGDAAAGVLSAEPGRPAVDANRFVRFQAVSDHLAEECARSPVCLVIDDVHAADPAMLLLARFIARSLPGLALTLVLTRRSGEVANDPDGGRLLAEIEADAVPIVLEPLDLAGTTDFLAVNGLAGLDVSLKSAVHRMTGGNPLSLRRVAALGTPGPGADSLPAGIRTAIDMALARLGPEARRILQAGAVLGTKPSVAVVADVAGCDPAAVLDAVAEGVAAGLVASEGTHRFEFGHEVIRSVLEDTLGGTDRLAAHAAAASLAGVEGVPSGDRAVRRAHHALAAAPRSPDDARRAVTACVEAAEAMTQSFAFVRADSLLSSAVDLHDRSTIGVPPGSLLVRWAEAALRRGRMNEARARFDRAVTVTRSANDPVLFAEAALGLGGHGVKEQRLPDERARVLGLQRAALAGLPDAAVELRGRLEARLAAEAVIDGAPLDALHAAVAAARRRGDALALGEALALWHHVLLTPEHTRFRLAIADELVEVAADAGCRVLGLMGLWLRTVDLLHLGDRRAVSALEEVRARASTVDSQNILANIAVLDAMLLIRAGRLDEAAAAADHARDLGEAAGEVNALNYHGAQVLGISWIQGRSADAAELAEQVTTLPGVVEGDFAFQATAAAFLAHASRQGRARAMVAELVGDDPASLPQTSSWLVGLAAIAEVASALDDAGLARQVYDLLVPYADLPTLGGSAVLCLGSTERVLGVASQTVGDLDRAVGHFERAIEEDRRLGHLPMAIVAHADLASALVRRGLGGDRERAAALFDRAIAEASRIGMTVRSATWQEARSALSAAGRARGSDRDRRGAIYPDGRRWVVALDDRRVRVPNLVGIRYMAELLTRPGQSIPALTLASQGLAPGSPGPQDLLDDEARAAYQTRARELAGDLAEAEADNDPARAEKARIELDALVDQLEAATGLGGRPRAFTDPTERARSSVSKAVKRAIDAIDDVSPEIAGALRATVSCGVVCSYIPDVQSPVVWSTRGAEVVNPDQSAEPVAPAARVPAQTATIGGRPGDPAAPAFAGHGRSSQRAVTRRLTGSVRISAMFPNVGGERLVRIIDAFEARHRDCSVQFSATPPAEFCKALRRGEIDFIATTLLRDLPQIEVAATLDTEPRVLAVARDHPLAMRRTQIEIEDLGDYTVAAPSILPDDLEEAWIPFHTPSGRRIERWRPFPATTNELAVLVARGKVVAPTLPTAPYFGLPSIVRIPIAGVPPVRVVLGTIPGASDPRRDEFIRVAREVTREPTT